jgi:glucose-1-phosphate thymidylyltransferase
MKGIILAGGIGSRLYPTTLAISKHLLPIFDKPMIYYSLSILMLAGIKDILIISTINDIDIFKRLLKDGSQLGIKLSYEIQDEPKGIADAFIIGEHFIGKDNVALILGDNMFYGQSFSKVLNEISKRKDVATIFGYCVKNPTSYGVIEFDNENNPIDIQEKPLKPKSNYVVPGLYFYTNEVIEIAKNLKMSSRGEIEITDVNVEFMKRKKLKIEILGRGMAWFDTGTHQGLSKASSFVEAIQSRQGLYVACLEEIALKQKFIDKEQIKKSIDFIEENEYYEYVYELINDKINHS